MMCQCWELQYLQALLFLGLLPRALTLCSLAKAPHVQRGRPQRCSVKLCETGKQSYLWGYFCIGINKLRRTSCNQFKSRREQHIPKKRAKNESGTQHILLLEHPAVVSALLNLKVANTCKTCVRLPRNLKTGGSRFWKSSISSFSSLPAGKTPPSSQVPEEKKRLSNDVTGWLGTKKGTKLLQNMDSMKLVTMYYIYNF